MNHIDPSGLICIYDQSSGQMTCVDDGGKTYYNEQGYSGSNNDHSANDGNGMTLIDGGRNDPTNQSDQGVGPIPEGDWELGSPYNDSKTGKNTRKLFPRDPNSCAATGRQCDTFRIHGNNKNNDASSGCIILPPNRTDIPTGEIIQVVP